MPRVNIYIRNEDWEAWNNIEDKPKWIHDGVTSGIVTIPAKNVRQEANQELANKAFNAGVSAAEAEFAANIAAESLGIPIGTPVPIKTNEQAKELVKDLPVEKSGPCRNGHVVVRGDKCAAKGCKYSVYAKQKS